MSNNKTKPTDADVDEYIAAIENDTQRNDCEALDRMFRKITKQQPKMWGSSIIGYGSYHYRYDSGREGDWCRTGFAARKNDLVVYLLGAGAQQEALLAKLGKYKMGKSCLYFKRLADIDLSVLEKLVKDSLTEIKRLYG